MCFRDLLHNVTDLDFPLTALSKEVSAISHNCKNEIILMLYRIMFYIMLYNKM